MNDPAILFYTSDFLTGVIDMTMEERGQYITLLCYQHQKGHFNEKTIRLLVGLTSDTVLKHFQIDNDGNYFNKRMDLEKEKRHNFVESRRENAKKGGRPKSKNIKPSAKPLGLAKINLMGNENDNENIIINDIINYMNNILNTNYKSTTESTKRFIRARLNEGFTLEQFKKVIDKKYNEWGQDKTMAKFLRPETLFGTKFESYLNQQDKNKAITPEWLGKDIESTTDETENKEFKEFIEGFRKE